MLVDKDTGYAMYYCDEFTCPDCGIKILTGWGDEPVWMMSANSAIPEHDALVIS